MCEKLVVVEAGSLWYGFGWYAGNSFLKDGGWREWSWDTRCVSNREPGWMGIANFEVSGARGTPSISEDVVMNIVGVGGLKDGDVVTGGGCGGGSGSARATGGGGGTTAVGPRPCHSVGSVGSVSSHVPQSKRWSTSAMV